VEDTAERRLKENLNFPEAGETICFVPPELNRASSPWDCIRTCGKGKNPRADSQAVQKRRRISLFRVEVLAEGDYSQSKMHFRAFSSCAMLMLALALTGCFPGGENHLDEEKDPHFQRGRNLASSQDYKAAVEEFERALESNPRSAAAHFELGWLYDTKINDYAAAIYHYERHLLYEPDSERAQLVRERIRGCRQQLANAEFPLPNSQNLQRDVDRLTAENQMLKQQLEAVRNQFAAYAASVQASAAQSASARVASGSDAAQGQFQSQPRGQIAAVPAAPAPFAASAQAASRRVHVVRQRETFSSIAAQYGIKATALMAANPRVEPRRLRVGQSLNLP
jgi:LysM repeat protein